jgi:hypothetical protein
MIKSSKATASRRRNEQVVAKTVRTLVAARDGFCRLACQGVGPCLGPSEWCHFGAHKRFNTRRMDPTLRHTTAGSFMACTSHHKRYDAGTITITALTELGCDGPLEIREAVEAIMNFVKEPSR